MAITRNALTARIRDQKGFDPETYPAESDTEDIWIDQVRTLEGIVDAIDEACARNAKGELSAGDVVAVCFAKNLGNCTTD